METTGRPLVFQATVLAYYPATNFRILPYTNPIAVSYCLRCHRVRGRGEHRQISSIAG